MLDTKQLLAGAEFYIQKHALPESTNEGFHLVDRFIDALKESQQKLDVAVEALSNIANYEGINVISRNEAIIKFNDMAEAALNTIRGK